MENDMPRFFTRKARIYSPPQSSHSATYLLGFTSYPSAETLSSPQTSGT